MYCQCWLNDCASCCTEVSQSWMCRYPWCWTQPGPCHSASSPLLLKQKAAYCHSVNKNFVCIAFFYPPSATWLVTEYLWFSEHAGYVFVMHAFKVFILIMDRSKKKKKSYQIFSIYFLPVFSFSVSWECICLVVNLVQRGMETLFQTGRTLTLYSGP